MTAQRKPLNLAIWWALVLILLAAATRLHRLDAQSLWNDEGNSYVQAPRSLAAIAENAARDIHPPGYYWLLKIWRVFTGDSEFALRALSAWVSVLSVAFTFALGRRLFGSVAGCVAALFVTLNTFSIYYAQEMRMYALLALWSAASMWALVHLLRMSPADRALPRWAIALGLANAAGLWTQYAFPFVMLAQGALILVWLRPERRGRLLLAYITANLLALLLYLPWLPTALSSVTTWPSTAVTVALSTALNTLLGWLAFGITYTVTDPSWIAIALVLLLFGLRREGTPLWPAALPILWVIVPVGLFLALGLYHESDLKLLLPAQIGFALWLGRGIQVLWHLGTSPRQRVLVRGTAAVAVLALTVHLWQGLNPLYHHPDYQRANYRALAQDVMEDARPGNAIILNAPNQAEVFGYYFTADTPIYPLPAGLGGDDDATRARVAALIADFQRVFVVYWGEAERDPHRVVETTLNAQAFEAASQWYGDVRLVRYSTPQPLTLVEASGAQFGEHIRLERFALSTDQLQAGDVLQLQLDWQTDAALDERYKVFVQLLDASGQLVAQRDSEPGGGLALTTTWEPDQTIIDKHALIIPNDLAPTHYTLMIGLYAIDDPLQRLRVADSDHLVLGTITVE
jgi:mannosyltransferase